MRTSPIIRLLALALVLMMSLSLPALADPCALCGTEVSGDTYICTACFLDLMKTDVSGGLEVTGATCGPDGAVTLTWTDMANNGPYIVRYELLDSAPTLFGWSVPQYITGNAVTLTQLVPGMNYLFTVTDASGNQATSAYFAPIPENGNEINAKIRVHSRLQKPDVLLELPLSASEIVQDNGNTHGFYMKLSYAMLRRTRYYNFSVTVEAPNGFADVVLSGTITLNSGKSGVPAWGFISLDDFFDCLQNYYGGVPTGEYVVTMHFDGKYVCSDYFVVKE